MSIGIIGAGAIGQAFARQLARAGIDVVISNSRGSDSLAALARDIGPCVTPGTVELAAEEEIVFVAVPWVRLQDALTDLPYWDGRIVIDANNPFVPPDFKPADLGGRTSSEIVADLVPGAHVVKAFNTLTAGVLAADPNEAGGRRVVFFSGDHSRAKAEVGRLIDRLGFAGIDLGRLAEGGKLQQAPGGPLAGLNLVKLS